MRINRPRRFPRLPAAAIVAAIALAVLAACGGDDAESLPPGPTVDRPAPEGEPRPFAMGFSSMPSEQTVESYVQAFATAAQYGELVLINRAPPWTEFFPNGQPSDDTLSTTRLETRLLDQYDALRLVYAIDPTDPAVSRTRLVDLPGSVSQAEGFLNEDLRNAFIGYALYVVRNYEPEYLALGVEVNMLRSRNREQFDAFVSLYNEAYDSVKESRPETKVFPTFQLEDLEGNLDDLHPPDWEALRPFAGRMDVLAISTYPYLAQIQSANDLRPEYYAQLRERWEDEVLIIETGYASAPVPGEPTLASEQDQDAFLQRLLADAEEAEFSGVIWRAALDPTYATAGTLTAFRDIGLRKGDGSNKAAWTTWETWARRPVGE